MDEGRKMKQNMLSRKQKKLLFYIAVLALPIIQVCIFYIYTHINSILLAFQKYDKIEGSLGYAVSFAGFSNFSDAFNILSENAYMIVNSLILYLLNLGVGFTLALIFSFYIYKRYVGSKIFQIILFAPNLISHLVFALLFKSIVNEVYPALFGLDKTAGLLTTNTPVNVMLGALYFYNIWIGFGVNVILFSGAMSGIDESLVEAAELDGANIVQEFLHVSIPMIFPTFVSFIIIGMVGIFTNQMGLVMFFNRGEGYAVGTLGYYLYMEASFSDVIVDGVTQKVTYSQLSALGVILTFIMLPLIMTVRTLLNKFGPRVD